jgi:hypothetical protein
LCNAEVLIPDADFMRMMNRGAAFVAFPASGAWIAQWIYPSPKML